MIKKDFKLQQMFIRKNIGKGRRTVYYRVFNHIFSMTGLTPTRLLEIAKDEQNPRIQDNRIIFKELEDRTITEIQYKYYQFAISKGLKNETIKSELSCYRAFLNEYNIQLPKNIQIRINQPLYQSGDLPQKKDILKAINATNNKRNKALIYFMSSTGIRPIDVRNMRIKTFLESCKYYLEDDLTLDNLFRSDYEHFIPCFYFRPQKTINHNNICCTFCTPETVIAIVDYLKSVRPFAEPDEYLFATRENEIIKKTSFITIFQRINDKEFGVNRYGGRFFQPRFLRKYFITTCNAHSGDLLKVRILAGHSLSNIDRAYNEINLNVMRRFYTSLVPYLSLNDTRVRDIKTKDYLELEQKLEKQKVENEKLRNELDDRINKAISNVIKRYK